MDDSTLTEYLKQREMLEGYAVCLGVPDLTFEFDERTGFEVSRYGQVIHSAWDYDNLRAFLKGMYWGQ